LISRIRKSTLQKEEFLRRPSNPPDKQLPPREFYSRPNKLEKPAWPPQLDVPRHESPIRTAKPIHQNFQRVKNDIDSERDIQNQNSDNSKQSIDNHHLYSNYKTHHKEYTASSMPNTSTPKVNSTNNVEQRLASIENVMEPNDEKRYRIS